MGKQVLFDSTGIKETLEAKSPRHSLSILSSVALLAIVALSFYAVFRGIAVFGPGYTLLDRLFAIVLLGVECFIFIQAIAFLLVTIKATKRYKVTKEYLFAPAMEPATAVLIATFNEEPSILEETVISVVNLDYAQKTIYIVDDSTNENLRQGIQDLAEKYGCGFVHRDNRRGYKAGAINDLMKSLSEKYMAVFDADQKPVHDFLTQIIPLLAEDPKLALVQTPQFYHNAGSSPVAFGAAHQQVIFYEYICEGKSVSDAMFTCGSNVVYRVEALRDISGFDEKSLTEDFATGLRLHMKGWKTLYYNRVSVYGLGPETLSGYFTQQMRWALGMFQVFKRMIILFIKEPRALHLIQWWEYFVSASYFLIGWAYFFSIIFPIAFLLVGVRPLIVDPILYLAAFLPYFIFSMGFFYLLMGKRGYKVEALFIGQALRFVSIWTLMNAAVMVLFNIKRAFGVTPKGASGKLDIKYLIPQLVLIVLSLAAVAVGIYKLINSLDLILIINIIWAAYHAFMLGMVFYFNRPSKPYQARLVFEEAGVNLNR